MKKDIRGRADIELLVSVFYDKVKREPSLGYIFNDVAKVNWNRHMPRMCDFWENVLFFAGKYEGEPMHTHEQLNFNIPLKERHFNKWKKLFIASVDELFEGYVSELAKQHAADISLVIQKRISDGQNL